jgi:hypothetical protein
MEIRILKTTNGVQTGKNTTFGIQYKEKCSEVVYYWKICPFLAYRMI